MALRKLGLDAGISTPLLQKFLVVLKRRKKQFLAQGLHPRFIEQDMLRDGREVILHCLAGAAEIGVGTPECLRGTPLLLLDSNRACAVARSAFLIRTLDRPRRITAVHSESPRAATAVR